MNNYCPRADSFPAQVCGFFANNPDETLTIDDMVDKFMPSNRGSIHTQLSLALDAKLLARQRDAEGDYVYSRGPQLQVTGWVDSSAAPATPAPARVSKPGGKRTALDLQAIRIRSGVPMPTNKTQIDRIGEFLVKLQVGDMFDLPICGKHILNKAVERQHKAKLGRFTTAVDQDAQTIGVWCVERATAQAGVAA